MTIPGTPRTTGKVNNAVRGSSVFLSPDTESGPQFTTQLLDQPGQIAAIVADHSAASIATKVLGGESMMNPGAAWFTKLDPADMAVGGLDERAEGSEYPMVRITPGDLQPLATSDIGGKFRVSDEAIRAGITNILADGISLITRGIVDRLDAMTVAALDAAATSTGHGTMPVPAWTGVQLAGSTPTAPSETPAAALVLAQTAMREHGLLARGDMLVLNPADDAALRIAYGAEYSTLLDGLGIVPAITSQVPAGTAYLVGTPNLGGLVSKDGLTAETWRDPSIRSTWCQVYLEPGIYISRPANVIRIEITQE